MKTAVGNYDKYSIFPQAGEVCTFLKEGKCLDNRVLKLPATLEAGMELVMTQVYKVRDESGNWSWRYFIQ